MRLPARMSGASIGPLSGGAMRLQPEDVAASAVSKDSMTTQSPDRQVKLAIVPTQAFLRGT